MQFMMADSRWSMDDGRRRLKAKKKFNEQQLSQRGHYADVFYFL
jgi:hypothetical protein